MYDVAVIGAGPAGATLARLIGERYRVLLIDKDKGRESPEGGSPGKCCGGLLAPDAQRLLSKLGLGLPRGVLEDPQLFVVKSIDLREGLERYYQRHYINMNRKKFDSWLLSLVPTGVEIRTGCRLRSFSQDRGAFTLTLGEGGKTYTEKTRILVGADGACSRVRLQTLGKQVWPKRYIAIQEWVEGDHVFPYFTSLFDPEITDFYCWTIPKGDHLIIGAALQPKKQPSEVFVRLKQKLRQYGFQYGRTVRREGAIVLRPLRTGHLSTGKAGVALLGEAGGWISPSSAEGLSYALKSALLLAEALGTTPHGFEKRYGDAANGLRRTIFIKNLKAHFIFNPVLRKTVMRWGVQSVTVYRP